LFFSSPLNPLPFLLRRLFYERLGFLSPSCPRSSRSLLLSEAFFSCRGLLALRLSPFLRCPLFPETFFPGRGRIGDFLGLYDVFFFAAVFSNFLPWPFYRLAPLFLPPPFFEGWTFRLFASMVVGVSPPLTVRPSSLNLHPSRRKVLGPAFGRRASTAGQRLLPRNPSADLALCGPLPLFHSVLPRGQICPHFAVLDRLISRRRE